MTTGITIVKLPVGFIAVQDSHNLSCNVMTHTSLVSALADAASRMRRRQGRVRRVFIGKRREGGWYVDHDAWAVFKGFDERSGGTFNGGVFVTLGEAITYAKRRFTPRKPRAKKEHPNAALPF